MDTEKYCDYDFKIILSIDVYSYFILEKGIDRIKVISNEWFCTENQARFAAIGHIILLENGAE